MSVLYLNLQVKERQYLLEGGKTTVHVYMPR